MKAYASGRKNEEIRKALIKARWKYIKPPLFALFLLVLLPLSSVFFYGFIPYLTYMPDVIFIAAIVVIFFGAWFDFGASSYLKDLKDFYHKTPTDVDMVYIQKQQLILTGFYILIGLLYISVSVLLYLILVHVF
ncbi:MAG: hypothetical protein M1592_02050 [Candidatus Thermoplasmatota archaeon]|nr:hypothetical protein [Candidatus Thermoplasmatota archaeon]